MSVMKRRSRTVSFRLTDKEYESMMVGCLSRGSRSLSEFARTVACEQANSPENLSIEVLKARVEELDRVVRNLNQKLNDPAGGNGHKEG